MTLIGAHLTVLDLVETVPVVGGTPSLRRSEHRSYGPQEGFEK